MTSGWFATRAHTKLVLSVKLALSTGASSGHTLLGCKDSPEGWQRTRSTGKAKRKMPPETISRPGRWFEAQVNLWSLQGSHWMSRGCCFVLTSSIACCRLVGSKQSLKLCNYPAACLFLRISTASMCTEYRSNKLKLVIFWCNYQKVLTTIYQTSQCKLQGFCVRHVQWTSMNAPWLTNDSCWPRCTYRNGVYIDNVCMYIWKK